MNTGPGKQFASGSVPYPASGPAVPYAESVFQQPLGFQNSGNQVPNYVQIQAQNVQFLPMQSYPGHSGLPAGLKVGPTGPGTQNFPMFPGHQTSFNGDTSASAKPPYYCTYIPVPTFQFPAIPGVSEYQRSHVSEKKDETRQSDATRNASYDLRSLGRHCFIRTVIATIVTVATTNSYISNRHRKQCHKSLKLVSDSDLGFLINNTCFSFVSR